MPRVPTYENFQVMPSANTGGRFPLSPIPPDAGVQAKQTGQALNEAGRMFAQIQAEQNQTIVDDYTNQLIKESNRLQFDPESGALSLQGKNAVERPNGKSLNAEYGEKFEAFANRLIGEDSNPIRKAALQKRALQISAQLDAKLTQHALHQNNIYRSEVYQNAIAINTESIGANYKDPDAVAGVRTNISNSVSRLAEINGWSAEKADIMKKEALSHSAKLVISNALDDRNWQYAKGWMEVNKGTMKADDLLWAREKIDKVEKVAVGQQYAEQLYRAAHPVVGESDTVVAITAQSESGNRDYDKSGNLLTSPKGAKGRMQVLDTTNLAPGFGVTPAKDNSPEERSRVGRDYIHAMIQRYDGDMAKAWAAYNWGPGNLDAHLKKFNAQQKGEGENALFDPNGWLEGAPKETRDYVTKNMTALEKERAKSRAPAMSQADISAQVMNISDPVLRKNTMDSYNTIVNFNKAREQEAGAAAIKKAMQMLPSVGYRISALSESDQSDIRPEDLPALQNWADKMAKGDDITDPAVYQYYATRPEALAKLTDDEMLRLRLKLSDTDYRHFVNERAKRVSGKANNGVGDLDFTAANREFDGAMRIMGIDPSPKKEGDMNVIGAKRRAFTTYLMTAQREAGKKFNDAEIRAHTGAFFTQTATSVGWFGNDAQQLMRMSFSNIGWHTRQKIRESLIRSGNPDPSNEQILEAFVMTETIRRKNAAKK